MEREQEGPDAFILPSPLRGGVGGGIKSRLALSQNMAVSILHSLAANYSFRATVTTARNPSSWNVSVALSPPNDFNNRPVVLPADGAAGYAIRDERPVRDVQTVADAALLRPPLQAEEFHHVAADRVRGRERHAVELRVVAQRPELGVRLRPHLQRPAVEFGEELVHGFRILHRDRDG